MTRRQNDQTSTGRSMNDVAREGNPLYLGFVLGSVSILLFFEKSILSFLLLRRSRNSMSAHPQNYPTSDYASSGNGTIAFNLGDKVAY